jgi:truncated hemoglobin YjbI
MKWVSGFNVEKKQRKTSTIKNKHQRVEISMKSKTQLLKCLSMAAVAAVEFEQVRCRCYLASIVIN